MKKLQNKEVNVTNYVQIVPNVKKVTILGEPKKRFNVKGSIEFNPYFRSANLEKCGDFKQIPANKERVRKAGRVMIIVNTPFTKTPVRFTVRTKSDYVAAFKAAKFIKTSILNKKKVVEPIVIETPIKYTFKRIRKIMRMIGGGTFKKVWKVTNNKNDVTKFFVTKSKAQIWVKNQPK